MMKTRFEWAFCRPGSLTGGSLALVLALVRPALGAPAVLDEVQVLAEGAPAVRLHLSAETPVQAQALPRSGDSPPRVYIDLAGTRMKPGTPRVIAGTGVVQRVRVGQFEPGTTRVVIDLERTLPFALRSTGDTVTIQLDAPGAGGPRPRQQPRAQAPPPPT